MRITTRGKVAVSAMTDLALHQRMKPVSLTTISQRQGTSLSYLEFELTIQDGSQRSNISCKPLFSLIFLLHTVSH